MASFPLLLGVLLMVGAGAASVLSITREGDTWHHVVIGDQILTTHVWPTTESHSFTICGNDSIAYDWLGEVVLALAFRLRGLSGLMGLLAGLSAAFMLLLYYYASQRSGNPKAAFAACLLLLPLAAPFFTLRPQLIGFMLMLVELILLDRFRHGSARALWVLPPLFLLWVNTHSSFFLGLAILGLYWVGGLTGFRQGGLESIPWSPGQRRQLEVIALLCVLALVATPYGTRLAASPLDLIWHSPLAMAKGGEFQPLSAFGALMKWFLFLLLVFLLEQIAFSPRYTVEEMGLLLVSIYGASVHARLLFLFVLVFAPLLAKLMGRWIPPYEPAKDRPVLNIALVVLMGVGVVKVFPSGAELEKDVSAVFPQRAVEYLRQHPVDGPMFHEYAWGSYLMLTMGSQHKVFIDGRSQLYEEAGVYPEYFRIEQVAPDAPFLLRKYGIRSCLIGPKTPLATFLAALPEWKRIYQDDLAILYIRTKGPL